MAPTELSKDYWLNIGRRGTFEDSHDIKSTKEDVDKFVEMNHDRISIFIHGGLVPECAGLKHAKTWKEKMLNYDTQPYAIIWETSFFDSISELLTDEFVEYLDKALKIFKNYQDHVLSIIYSGNQKSSYNETEDIEWLLHEFEQGIISEDITLDALPPKLQTIHHTNQKGIFDIKLLLIRSAKNALVSTIKRYRTEKDHGLPETFIEEMYREIGVAYILKESWESMKKKAVDSFYPDNDHVGYYLLSKLSEKQVKIDLIGHSAGAIFINEMVKTSREKFPTIKYENIILLAPACTMQNYHDGLMSCCNDTVDNICIMTMEDKLEQKDYLIHELIYPSSMLYFISGLLENEVDMPILGLQRHIDGNFKHHNKIDNAVKEHVKGGLVDLYYSKISGSSETTADKHGDFFSEDRPTIKTIQNIISK